MERNMMKYAVKELKANLTEVARVCEWADLMGYENPKKFSEKFLRHYGVRPQKLLELVRLESIVRALRNRDCPNLRIARMHSLPDEKTLNNYTNYHIGYSPTDLKRMSEDEIHEKMEKLWSRMMEEYGVGKVWSARHRKVL